MAKNNFDASLDKVLVHEGGYSNDAADTGGATKYGITIGVLSEYRGKKQTVAQVKALTIEEAKEIYKQRYWDPLQGDKLPKGSDYCIFDFGVNSGIFRSAQYVQRIIGVHPDGKIGPVTLSAIVDYPADRLINELCNRRQEFLYQIVANRPSQKVFIKGWTRRVSEVRRDALKMLTEIVKAVVPAKKEAPKKTKPVDEEPKKATGVILGWW